MDYSYYLTKFSNPSATYKKFVRDYIVERATIAGRGEEDISIWCKLEGDELDTAKDFIFEHLKENPKIPYILAAGTLRDEKVIPILRNIIQTCPDRYVAEKLLAAKVLYEWIGYSDYIIMLEKTCRVCDDEVRNYLRVSIGRFIDGLLEKDKLKIIQALERV